MKYLLIPFLLLSTPQIAQKDNLQIQHRDKIIKEINHKEFLNPLLGEPYLNQEKYDELLEEIDQQAFIEPKNAYINENGMIMKEKAGFKLYRKQFTEKFLQYFYEKEPRKITIPLLSLHPKVDSELLASIRTQRIGQYITYFNKNNKERANNITLATEAINNHVVFPGETFSFNEVVGKRTIEKGYLSAPVIIKGELSEGIGGGICQVSSTLFNAADNAGVEIVQRYSHSRKVPYVPPGRDATVSWYGPDFTFKNKYNQPLLIRAKIYGGQMIVQLFSSDVIEFEQRKVPSMKNVKKLNRS
ncbi:vancomycin resistance protein YoaR [Bacillus pakistanensis]|uniref:Vancomycin resistance protein YoaR n=1 Tax=Rossellomorea pakistanensis TaxID=992288 RepID=A0ABS2N7F9_9BACI|nr:VanW family protein [Bacillus pakistanensis]MBM7583791.1 vancomycin resistance protein YoaR [Bacillus pakistanensis]